MRNFKQIFPVAGVKPQNRIFTPKVRARTVAILNLLKERSESARASVSIGNFGLALQPAGFSVPLVVRQGNYPGNDNPPGFPAQQWYSQHPVTKNNTGMGDDNGCFWSVIWIIAFSIYCYNSECKKTHPHQNTPAPVQTEQNTQSVCPPEQYTQTEFQRGLSDYVEKNVRPEYRKQFIDNYVVYEGKYSLDEVKRAIDETLANYPSMGQ